MYIKKYDSGEENSETILGSSITNELLNDDNHMWLFAVLQSHPEASLLFS
jgi:hypothetical protein